MKEQVNIKVLRDYLVHLDWSLINIKDHQLHNKDIYFENYSIKTLQQTIMVFRILFGKFLM
jgi:hypothetical protein